MTLLHKQNKFPCTFLTFSLYYLFFIFISAFTINLKNFKEIFFIIEQEKICEVLIIGSQQKLRKNARIAFLSIDLTEKSN